jgi:hypothetical protein
MFLLRVRSIHYDNSINAFWDVMPCSLVDVSEESGAYICKINIMPLVNFDNTVCICTSLCRGHSSKAMKYRMLEVFVF